MKPDIRSVLVSLSEQLNGEVGLCLSSGTDSISMLFALLEAKKVVKAYSFFLEGYAPVDAIYSRRIAERFNVPFQSIMLPNDLAGLQRDCVQLNRKFACKSKTQFECVWPFLYTYPVISEPIIATGLGAGGHFCLSKKGMIHFKDRIEDFRDDFFARPNAAQMPQHKLLSCHFNKQGFHPWMTNEMRQAFIGTSWNDLNKPKTKQALLDSFPQFKQIKIFSHTNLQLGDSGISQHFTKLLKSDWNEKLRAKSVVGIYNALDRGELPPGEPLRVVQVMRHANSQ